MTACIKHSRAAPHCLVDPQALEKDFIRQKTRADAADVRFRPEKTSTLPRCLTRAHTEISIAPTQARVAALSSQLTAARSSLATATAETAAVRKEVTDQRQPVADLRREVARMAADNGRLVAMLEAASAAVGRRTPSLRLRNELCLCRASSSILTLSASYWRALHPPVPSERARRLRGRRSPGNEDIRVG